MCDVVNLISITFVSLKKKLLRRNRFVKINIPAIKQYESDRLLAINTQ